MARTLGADACGMSTAIEAIASNHMSIKTIGISLMANMACGVLKEKLSDDDVVAMGIKSKDNITELFKIALREMDKNV